MAYILPDKALSIRQPWAWCIVKGYKPVENRDWNTKFRGPLTIHAGKAFDRQGYDWIRMTFPQIPLPQPDEFERGGIVGIVNVHSVVQEHDLRLLRELFSARAPMWFFGKYGFVMTDARTVPFLPCAGKLGIFKHNA